MNCPDGHSNSADAAFCTTCGTALTPPQRVCQGGHIISGQDRFCTTCGATAGESEAAVAGAETVHTGAIDLNRISRTSVFDVPTGQQPVLGLADLDEKTVLGSRSQLAETKLSDRLVADDTVIGARVGLSADDTMVAQRVGLDLAPVTGEVPRTSTLPPLPPTTQRIHTQAPVTLTRPGDRVAPLPPTQVNPQVPHPATGPLPTHPTAPPSVAVTPPPSVAPFSAGQGYPAAPSAYHQQNTYPQQGGYPQAGYQGVGQPSLGPAGYGQAGYGAPGYPQQAAWAQPVAAPRKSGAGIAAAILIPLALGAAAFFLWPRFFGNDEAATPTTATTIEQTLAADPTTITPEPQPPATPVEPTAPTATLPPAPTTQAPAVVAPPPATETPSQVYARSSGVNIRSNPNCSAAEIGYVPEGDSVLVTGPDTNGWFPVEYYGTVGWVSGFLISGPIREVNTPLC